MEVPLETYRHIVKHVTNRGDLCALCRVNKRIQCAAEGALYNTIYATDTWDTFRMCSLFAKAPRLAAIVEVLSLFVGNQRDIRGSPQPEVCFPKNFWSTISTALHNTTRLCSLSFHLDNASDAAQAWILNGAIFRLHTFYCDLQWDGHLVSFLSTQPNINDLYIADYSVFQHGNQISQSTPSTLDSSALGNLSTLECTFSEAACALVPMRPISRLKTCLSKTRLSEKRAELSVLFSRLMMTTRPLRSLDIADSSYSESFSMDLLTSVVRLQNHVLDLRYLGTLVLPIDGDLRLKFYGLLRVLHSLECVEADVSEWEPPPSIPAGVRALASELRLYCPNLRHMIFVHDFERTVITVSRGSYALDCDTDTKNIWREL